MLFKDDDVLSFDSFVLLLIYLFYYYYCFITMNSHPIDSDTDIKIIKNKYGHLFARLGSLFLVLFGFGFVIAILVKFGQIKWRISELQLQNTKLDEMISNIKKENSNVESLLQEAKIHKDTLKTQIEVLTSKIPNEEVISNEILDNDVDILALKQWAWKKLSNEEASDDTIRNRLKFKMIYKSEAEKDNDSRQSMINAIGESSPLLIVIKSRVGKFGAFTTLPLMKRNQFDRKAFLFTLDLKKKFDLKETYTFSDIEALYFGEDLVLHDKFLTNKGSSNFPSQNVLDYQNQIGSELSNGVVNFSVIIVEVYKVSLI